MSDDGGRGVSADMRLRVLGKLTELAEGDGFRVLYAAESGSRAWGFGSPDSDYDVRFIYARPVPWYLRLNPGRDVVEAGIDADLIDLSGWDVDKALKLLMRSNPTLYEWLVSPIVYMDDGAFAAVARQLFEETAERKALAHHYRSIAFGQWRRELAGREQVRLKKYFYVIRPLLSYQWVIRQGTPPPMQIECLLATSDTPQDLRKAVEDLIVLKRETPELGDGPRIGIVDAWIEETFGREMPDLGKGDEALRLHRRDGAQALFQATIGFSEAS